ncbi:response regulator [Glaciimonas sp. GG7]
MQHIVLADNHPVIIAGVRGYIDRCADLSVAAIARSTDQLLARLKDTRCDVLITDISMPAQQMCDGLTLLSYVKRHHPNVCLIVLTMNTMPAVLYQIIKSEVDGVLHMNDEIATIRYAIDSAAKKSRYISKSVRDILRAGPVGKMPSQRETEVIRMYANGHSIREIATRLNKSVKTIALQKTSAMKKMGLRNDVELGRYSLGGVELP